TLWLTLTFWLTLTLRLTLVFRLTLVCVVPRTSREIACAVSARTAQERRTRNKDQKSRECRCDFMRTSMESLGGLARGVHDWNGAWFLRRCEAERTRVELRRSVPLHQRHILRLR